MSSWTFSSVVLFFITFQISLSYDDMLNNGSHRDPVATDIQTTTPRRAPWTIAPVITQPCVYTKNATHHIISVDCLSKGQTKVPDLPETTVELTLRDNAISSITCDSFKLLRRLQHIDLSFNRIQHVEPCTFQSQSSSLVDLSLSKNRIGYLDVNLFRGLSYLEKLDLSRNDITYLASNTFSDLVRLTDLYMSFNYINNIEAGAFKGLHSLKTLYLQNNRLDEVSSFHKDVFQDLAALERLDVKANEGILDDAISPLRNLTHLSMDIVDSTYEVMGTGFRQLTNLRIFDMSSEAYIRRVGYKSTSTCSISMIPSTFFENIQTERDLELYMSFCDIKVIGDYAFLPLSTLVTLDLSYNDDLLYWTRGDENWMDSLSNTTITFLDITATSTDSDSKYENTHCFRGLAQTNLKTFVVKGNNIEAIEGKRCFPTSIEKLNLNVNMLYLDELYTYYLTSNLGSLKLRELRASYQGHRRPYTYTRRKRSDRERRASVPAEAPDTVLLNSSHIKNTSMGETLNLLHADTTENEYPIICPLGPEGIQTICLPADLEVIYANFSFRQHGRYVWHIRVLNNTVLRHVELAYNYLTTWVGPIENVPSLTYLDLSNNLCDLIEFDFFKYMVSLETLILKENELGISLGRDVNGLIFSTLSNLRMLNLSSNDIKDLSTLAFIHNTNIETLDLSNNHLSEFQPSISTIRNMSFIDLSVNRLSGLSEETCKDLNRLKSRNKNFAINLLDNRLSFTCDYLPFLDLVFSTPQIFFRVEHLKFKYLNGSTFDYNDLAHHFPLLSRECLVRQFFFVILIVFFLVVGTVSISAVIYYSRWKIRYLYYIGRRRMHIGEHMVDYTPDADVFITYDQDDLRWRRFMQRIFLPGLNQRNITHILGETDFPGGDLMAHVTGAVVGTRKTVVLLSLDIFDDHHREFEMNLAIMREMDTRCLKIVPVFVEEVDLALYPREIELFLRNQWPRCLSYSDSDDFWDSFLDAVREDN